MIGHLEELRKRLWHFITWEIREENIQKAREAYEEALEKVAKEKKEICK